MMDSSMMPSRLAAAISGAPTGQMTPVPLQAVQGIGNRFGQPTRTEGIHRGLDIQAVAGTPAVAPVAGTVVDIRNEPAGLGWIVVIQGPDGMTHQMDHLREGSIAVQVGDRVQQGDQVAMVGESGAGATGPHMDYRMRDRQGNYQNPEGLLPPEIAGMGMSPNTVGVGGDRRTPVPPREWRGQWAGASPPLLRRLMAGRVGVGGDSTQLFGEEARQAWLAAGAPDYNAPTKDESGNVTGYQSVADQPAEQRSAENQNVPATIAWLAAGAPDYKRPVKDAAGNVTGYQSVTATPVAERSVSNQALERMIAGYTQQFLQAGKQSQAAMPRSIGDVTTGGGMAGVRAATPGSDAYYRELAARRHQEQFGGDLQAARNAINYGLMANPGTEGRAYAESALGMAQAGQLDYLLDTPAPPPAATGPSGQRDATLPAAADTQRSSASQAAAAAAGLPKYEPYRSEMQVLSLGGDDRLQGIIDSLTRRSALLGQSLAPDKTRADRTLAALYQNVPAVRELLATDTSLDLSDWRGAVKKWAEGQEVTNLEGYAVEQGFMPKPPPRTVVELVDQAMYDLLKQQGLISPDIESRLNQQLEGQYQADIAGTEPPVPPAAAESAAFLPPIPSTQMYNTRFNAAEQQGVGQLFGAMGMTPEMLADAIRQLAPPSGNDASAVLGYRRR